MPYLVIRLLTPYLLLSFVLLWLQRQIVALVFILPMRMCPLFAWTRPRRTVSHLLPISHLSLSISQRLIVIVQMLVMHVDTWSRLVLAVAIAIYLAVSRWPRIRHRYVLLAFARLLNRHCIGLLAVRVPRLRQSVDYMSLIILLSSHHFNAFVDCSESFV